MVATTESTAPLTYVWFRVGSTTPIGSCTTFSCTVSPTATSQYVARIVNACGAVDSQPATVTVCGSPAVSVAPSETPFTVTPVTLTATASG